MRYEIEVNGRLRRVDLRRERGRFLVTLDDRQWTIDATRIDPHTWSLLAGEGGPSYVVTLAPPGPAGRMTVSVGATPVDVVANHRRRARSLDPVHNGSGPQRIVSPMPGKIVRVLVKPGDVVKARQPVVVIEAMKMENELRAQADGTVTAVPGREGQSVEAGVLLAVIEAQG